MAIREITSGLKFPEGPVAMDDGSVILVEIEAGRVTRVKPDGKKQVIAKTGGGPNGAAIGPDGALYVCNNGDNFDYHKRQGLNIPGHTPPHHKGGWIERVDISTGKVERLYSECDGQKLHAPNDIVFDTKGGFWFTDHGSTTTTHRTHGYLYYAQPDGSKITCMARELISPNGVGLSPSGDAVYYAETFTGRLYKLPLKSPGKPGKVEGFTPGQFVGAFPGHGLFRLAGRAGRWQRVRGDVARRWHHHLQSRNRQGQTFRAARSACHQYLLGRQGYENGVHHRIGHGQAARGRLAESGLAFELQRLSAIRSTECRHSRKSDCCRPRVAGLCRPRTAGDNGR